MELRSNRIAWRWLLAAMVLAAPFGAAAEDPPSAPARSAVFLHPDGMGAGGWSAVRLHEVGVDGRLAWDRLPQLAVYVGPMLDAVNATSNGGATVHAYGVRARLDSFGLIDGRQPVARSGRRMSLMQEAQAAGKRVALVNSSSLTEPGTAAFLASVEDRDGADPEIASQLLAARPEILLGGGERFFLPRGLRGSHGEGVRTDGRNLVEEARAAGYTIVHTRDELAAVPEGAGRVLGLFAADHTFNEADERGLAEQGLAAFQPQAPRFDEMVAFAIGRLAGAPNGYLLVANEEATDNLSGENNAPATIEAAAGADRAIARVLAETARDPRLTLVVASDSENGGLQATGDDLDELPRPLPRRSGNGSPLDSRDGDPFLTPPDRHGVRHPFYIVWASDSDMAGGTLVRGAGPGAAILHGTVDSTAVYEALYLGLFGRMPND